MRSTLTRRFCCLRRLFVLSSSFSLCCLSSLLFVLSGALYVGVLCVFRHDIVCGVGNEREREDRVSDKRKEEQDQRRQEAFRERRHLHVCDL